MKERIDILSHMASEFHSRKKKRRRQLNENMRNVDDFFRESKYNNLRILLTICGVSPFQALSKRCAMYVGFTLLFISVMIFEVHRERKREEEVFQSVVYKLCYNIFDKICVAIFSNKFAFSILCDIYIFFSFLNIFISTSIRSKDHSIEKIAIFFTFCAHYTVEN